MRGRVKRGSREEGNRFPAARQDTGESVREYGTSTGPGGKSRMWNVLEREKGSMCPERAWRGGCDWAA